MENKDNAKRNVWKMRTTIPSLVMLELATVKNDHKKHGLIIYTVSKLIIIKNINITKEMKRMGILK